MLNTTNTWGMILSSDARKISQSAKLSDADVSTIRGMVARGDRQVDVAMWHGISPSTVNKIAREKLYRSHVAPRVEGLPPRGPYVVVAKTVVDEIEVARVARLRTITELEALIAKLRGEAATQPEIAVSDSVSPMD